MAAAWPVQLVSSVTLVHFHVVDYTVVVWCLAVSVNSRTNRPRRVQLGLTAPAGLYLGVVARELIHHAFDQMS